MAQTIVNLDNANNAGGEETYVERTSQTLDTSDTLFHYNNGFDVATQVTFDGSRAGDDDFSESIELNTESVASAASAYFVLSEPWEQVQITVDPDADPTTGTFTLYRSDEN